MLPHGYLLPQVVAVVLARPLAQRDMWGRHSRSLGDRRARLRGVQEGVFLAGGIRRAYPHVGEGRTWKGGVLCQCRAYVNAYQRVQMRINERMSKARVLSWRGLF